MNLNPLNWLTNRVRERVATAVTEGIAQGLLDGLEAVEGNGDDVPAQSAVALLQQRMRAIAAPKVEPKEEEPVAEATGKKKNK